MNLVPDKSYRSTYKIIKNCALVKLMEIAQKEGIFKEKKLNPYISWLDTDESAQPFKDFLVSLYQKEQEASSNIYILNPNATQLLNVPIQKSDYIPPEFEEQFAEYLKIRHQFSRFDDLEQEYRNLIDLIDRRDYQGARSYISRFEGHSSDFQRFAKDMKERSQISLCKTYKDSAKRIAETSEFHDYTDEKLNQVFTPDQVSLRLSDLGKSAKRRFTGTIVKYVMPLLAGAIIGNAVTANFTNRNEPIAPDSGSHTSEPAPTPEPDPSGSIIIETEPDDFIPPISNSIKITSYATACKDFYQKTAEVYKYNTGEDIDLNYLKQENMGTSSITVFVVTKENGETIRFSAQSPHSTNATYLEQALASSGLTYTKEPSTQISYIFDDDKSLAITDSSGHPIKSGNVLEDSYDGRGEMFNQTYVNAGRKILEEKGIDTTNKSDAELVGAYITSDSYNIQNPELSKALGVTQDLLKIIKKHFYYTNGKESEYTYNYVYANASEKLAERFNNQARNQYQGSKDFLTDRDER